MSNASSPFFGKILGISCIFGASLATAQPAAKREFPVGRPQAINELPASRLQTELEKLPPAARERARAWLGGFHFTEADLPSLHTDADGGICYACQFEKAPAAGESAPSEPESPAVSAAAVPVSPFPSSLVFNSRPGSVNVLYINFSGVNVTNTQWNTLLNRTSIPAVAYSTDSDYATFSDAEQTAIKRIWQRMAEDFAPFNINVTTQAPSTYTSRTAVALITRKTDANGAANPYNTGGGVAYVDVFGRSDFATYSPAWIYHDNLSNTESLIAEAASHEIGHNLGLSHDGTSTKEYYGGHGSGDTSWGPIMGTGYNRNVSQWSKGEYLDANNTQDDLATIAGKIGYRPSDHGSTRGTATALTITSGTQIVSTTPENDPTNLNPANKGVLEGTQDVDVFSFVTGSGPVQFTVNPWIGPDGTRGGNLDILLEIYDEAGALLVSNNDPGLTYASIQTSLPEGLYYLYVKNSKTGSPLDSSPSGYTFYGSIGQYFINGSISDATGFVVPPVAEAQTADLIEPDQLAHSFSVTYSDNLAINVATIDSNDIQVTGPGGYVQLAARVSVDFNTNGTPRVATYSVTPAGGGSWSPAQNGTYIISMLAEQVADTEGTYVPAGELGQFNIAIARPVFTANMDTATGWTLEPQWAHGVPNYSTGGPTSAFTGSKIIGYNLSGDYPNNLGVKYATSPLIDTSGFSSLTLSFRRWLGLRSGDNATIQASTNGVTWVNVWSTTSSISDSSWQLVQYALPEGLAGSSSLRLRWGLSSGGNGNKPAAKGWNIDDVQLFGDGAIDSAPPVASLNVSSITLGGSPSHSCSVTYTDETGVLLASLDSTNLLVTGPNLYFSPAEFTGADQLGNSLVITGSYSILAPGGSWDPADNGTYTVTLQNGTVEDTLGNVIPETVLGTFDVFISAATLGFLAVTPAEDFAASGTAGGSFSPGSKIYTLTNNGETTLDWTANNSAAWLTLDASSGTLAAGASANVIVTINSEAINLPAGVHNDTINFINTTDGSGDTSRDVTLTAMAPLRLTSLTTTEAGVFQMVIQGTPGANVLVEASADLMLWQPLVIVQIEAGGSVTVSDSASADLPTRFYRLSASP